MDGLLWAICILYHVTLRIMLLLKKPSQALHHCNNFLSKESILRAKFSTKVSQSLSENVRLIQP